MLGVPKEYILNKTVDIEFLQPDEESLVGWMEKVLVESAEEFGTYFLINNSVYINTNRMYLNEEGNVEAYLEGKMVAYIVIREEDEEDENKEQ